MKYAFGSIKVETEIQEGENRGKIKCLSDAVARYDDLGDEQKEHIYAVFLTNANEEIGDKLIGLGGSDAVQFEVKDIARTAVLVNAGAVILVHNHPSGVAEPTRQDIETTQEIHEALQLFGVKLLDHVIIADNDHYSMRRSDNPPFNDTGSAQQGGRE